MTRIDKLLSEMTLEEKVSLLAGASFWETVPIKRLGVPSR
jgi:beta-glucosidase